MDSNQGWSNDPQKTTVFRDGALRTFRSIGEEDVERAIAAFPLVVFGSIVMLVINFERTAPDITTTLADKVMFMTGFATVILLFAVFLTGRGWKEFFVALGLFSSLQGEVPTTLGAITIAIVFSLPGLIGYGVLWWQRRIWEPGLPVGLFLGAVLLYLHASLNPSWYYGLFGFTMLYGLMAYASMASTCEERHRALTSVMSD